MSPTPSKSVCCFCGGTIDSVSPEPVSMTIELNLSGPDKPSQTLYSHVSCLRVHLHPSVPPYLLDAYESPTGGGLS